MASETLLLSRSEACARLGIGRSTLAQLIARKDIFEIKIGRRSLIACEELLRFIRERSNDAATP